MRPSRRAKRPPASLICIRSKRSDKGDDEVSAGREEHIIGAVVGDIVRSMKSTRNSEGASLEGTILATRLLCADEGAFIKKRWLPGHNCR
jgi:hypothetical protein